MDETGYTCPKCGNTESFHADYVVATFWGCYIYPDGWDYSGSEGHVEFDESTNLRCMECGYESNHNEFEEDLCAGSR